MHKAFLARIVEEGPISAIHGVVCWRACELIMRLYEEFGLSVSDDTIYRALKNLGFSHVSARPKAYKQSTETMNVQKNFTQRAAEIRAKLAARRTRHVGAGEVAARSAACGSSTRPKQDPSFGITGGYCAIRARAFDRSRWALFLPPPTISFRRCRDADRGGERGTEAP
jgi:hypothetical protein